MFSPKGEYVTGSKHIVEDDIMFTYPSGGKMGNTSGGHGVLSFPQERTWFKLAVTSSNQFLPVVTHDIKGNSMAFHALLIWIHQGWLCDSDLSGLKLKLPIHVLNYCVQE